MSEVIEDLQVAKSTILHRSQKPTDYPDHVLSGVERIFGDGVLLKMLLHAYFLMSETMEMLVFDHGLNV